MEAPQTVPTLPTWEELRQELLDTGHGAALAARDQRRDEGLAPHTDAKVRYFGQGRGKPRVTLYRDQAAWCPYCQKVWLLLEAKGVDYEISKVPMRSYGDKPDEFLQKVPRGLLPAIEIDGRLMTESLDIMFTIERVFSDAARPMFPPAPGPERVRATQLLELERALFGAWCGFLFRPEVPFIGGNLNDFEAALSQVDQELASGSTDSPWFLGHAHPTIVDMQYVSHVERMVASALYFKGYDIRGKFEHIDKWLVAFEKLPYYMATKSDYYTHCQDIPPQYGQPFESGSDEAERSRAALDPRGSSLPIRWEDDPEPLTHEQRERPVEEFKAEAAWALVRNNAAVAKFCCRAAGGGVGDWGRGNPTRSALSDPYARSAQDLVGPVSEALRAVAKSLVDQRFCDFEFPPAEEEDGGEPGEVVGAIGPGVGIGKAALRAAGAAGLDGRGRQAMAACLDYLRDRVGVPRDLSMPAAKYLRAHLSMAASALR